MNIAEFTERFFRIEAELKLFEEKINETAWWDAVRFYVFYDVYDQLAGIHRQKIDKPSVFFRVNKFVRREIKRFYFGFRTTFNDYDVLVFRAPRGIVGGRLVDESMDPVADVINNSKLVIDTCPLYYHRRSMKPDIPEIDSASFKKIEEKFSLEFGKSFRLADMIKGVVDDFYAQIGFYLKLFRKINPKIVLLTQNGVEKGMMVAAKRLKIPLVEVQHGLISFFHPIYSYSKNINYSDIETIPSHLLTYSEFWNDTSYMPFVKKISIGKFSWNDHLCKAEERIRYDFLFISADKYDSVLRKLSKEISSAYPQKKIGYKLHPKQSPNEQSIRDDLSEFRNVYVLTSSISINMLLQQTDCIVAVQSTAVYEALQAGVKIVIVEHGDYLIHKDVFFLPQVFVANEQGILETISQMLSCTHERRGVIFFDEFSRERVRTTLEEIANNLIVKSDVISYH